MRANLSSTKIEKKKEITFKEIITEQFWRNVAAFAGGGRISMEAVSRGKAQDYRE